ncbi:mitochondrial metalloendopeptidase OMA1 [Amaranthus tricolor]|uniref:mitochondrial metalloendopeptidase OMA1 n=1 Tax=Amaranthus tricolor TaxID=29722 RepID=UPI002585ADEE|nr:mitochondrial metalloendopeptidase OMA1 [Amaranthus tricolor]
MSWYKRSKFVNDAFKRFSFKVLTKNPPQSPIPRINSNANSLFHNQFKSSGLIGSPSSTSKFRYFKGFEKNQSNLFSGNFRRNYYVDRNQIYHFKPRGYKSWFQNPRIVLITVVIGSGVVITVYFGNSEIVPYTKRKHVVLLSRTLERQLGESEFNQLKKEYKGKILPAIHPDSVRVRLISRDIIEGLKRGISHEQVWSDPSYTSESFENHGVEGHQTLKSLTEEKEEKLVDDWRKEEEILDDTWMKTSRKHGEQHGTKASTEHLEGMNWEVLVVNEPMVNAFCLPGGKIVVFTGLLNHFKTDAELATVIGHEVGHAIARHSAEQITKNLWFAILQLILVQFIAPDFANAMSSLLLRLPFSRKMEIEADYIGLLLMASAGYDPRVAPRVYEKLGMICGESSMRDYLSTHPSGKKRAQLLAQAHIMEEAINMYREVMAGRAIEGFL